MIHAVSSPGSIRQVRAGAFGAPRDRIFGALQARIDLLPTLLPISVIVLAAILLRSLNLTEVGFTSDEAVYSGQAAALAGDAGPTEFFSIFRAHPLLLQLITAGAFLIFGTSDLVARLVVGNVFGVGSVIMVYLLAARLYGPRTALFAAALLAFNPYHIAVSRQAVLDVPLGFWVLVTLWFAAKASEDRSGGWFIATCVAAGLGTLTKETGVLVLPPILLAVTMHGYRRELQWRPLILGGLLFGLLVLPFPLSRLLWAPDGGGTAYVLWQITRASNHSPDYFPQVLLEFAGVAFVLLALVGFVVQATQRSYANALLILVTMSFAIFHQLWATKLFIYPAVIIGILAIAGAIGAQWIGSWASRQAEVRGRRLPSAPLLSALVLGAAVVSALPAAVVVAKDGPDDLPGTLSLSTGTADFVGAREFAEWAKENTPPNARFLTIGPSLGNVLSFYGERPWLALSVSPNASRRNPAYVPVPNPDLWIRSNSIHYIVWDSLSAGRSIFYADRLTRFVDRFRGTEIFGVYELPGGSLFQGTDPPVDAEPRIRVFSVRGGAPDREFQ